MENEVPEDKLVEKRVESVPDWGVDALVAKTSRESWSNCSLYLRCDLAQHSVMAGELLCPKLVRSRIFVLHYLSVGYGRQAMGDGD